jgi:hypothetical protein
VTNVTRLRRPWIDHLSRGSPEGSLSFSGAAIRTTNATPLLGPPPLAQTDRVLGLHGSAKLVDF